MSEERGNFGQPDLFDAEAIGQPGNRRFRLYARGRGRTASLWLEREHLEALAQAIDQLLAEAADGGMVLRAEAQADTPKPPSAPADFPDDPDIEFQVSKLRVGYDQTHDRIILQAAPVLLIERDGELFADDDAEIAFGAALSRSQAERVSTHINLILSSGRPRCPFCGRPMQSGHFCDKQNGFHPVGLN